MKLFDEIPYLEDDTVIIRRMTEEDAGVLDEMYSDKQATRYLPTFLFERQFEDKKEAIRQMYAGIFERRESLLLGVYLKSDPEKMVGIAEFYNYDPKWNKASIGVRLNGASCHAGIGKHVNALMMNYLFEKTDVKRVTAHVIAENAAAQKAVQRAGFRLRKTNVEEDWGLGQPVRVNKFVAEKLGNIRYVKIGFGPKPMVMLPGLAFKSTLGSVDLIDAAYRDIFKEYTIYLFDDRDCIREDYTLRERAGDIAAEMHTLGIKGAYVFGASMGGMVAMYLAIDHPKLVKKLVISSSAAYLTDSSREVFEHWKQMAEQFETEELVHQMVTDIYSPATLAKCGEEIETAIGCVSDTELHDFAVLTGAILGCNCYEDLDRISCLVLIIGTEGDRVYAPEAIRKTAEKLGCEVYLYGPEYGHAVYDEAEDHRQRILDFFEK